MSKEPKKATLYAFNVGFGDCLLLEFEYAGDDKRHALIDFGSTARSKTHPRTMAEVAKEIAHLCDGELDLLVVTHRHEDHISGFATREDGKGPGDIIAGLNPRLLLMPWTEDPDADQNATEATRSFVRSLDAMSAVAGDIERGASRRAASLGADGAERLRFKGEDNVKNLSAVKNLVRMGRAAQYGARYLKFGDKVSLARILPGVTLHVLGPPSLEQSDAIRTMKSKNADEYWHMRAGQLDAPGGGAEPEPLFPDLAGEPPVYARWVAERAREAEAELAYGIVTALDDQMNNTSLILVFEAGGRKLLFPGDAQWENWSYALDQSKRHYERIEALLGDVDLYKVGHHGSLNATPKSMWALLKKKGAASRRGRLKSMLSTLPGKHGGKHGAKTEVPRRTLVTELKTKSDFTTTETAASYAKHEIALN